MPALPCPETPAVIAAARNGTLTRNPRLSTHLQVCSHCLGRVFGDFRQVRCDPTARLGTRQPHED